MGRHTKRTLREGFVTRLRVVGSWNAVFRASTKQGIGSETRLVVSPTSCFAEKEKRGTGRG